MIHKSDKSDKKEYKDKKLLYVPPKKISNLFRPANLAVNRYCVRFVRFMYDICVWWMYTIVFVTFILLIGRKITNSAFLLEYNGRINFET